jgi:hypothetical protein
MAVSANGYVPTADFLAVEIGVPNSVAVPLWLFTKCTPLGSLPTFLILGVGGPAVVTVNENGAPATTV